MTARFVNQLGDAVLGVAVALDELAKAFRLFERVQILALNVLDQRELGDGRWIDVAHDRRNRVQLGTLGRAPASLPSHDHARADR